MKVLHLIPSYMPAYRYGGPIWSVHNLNKWLVKNGVEVTVYTTNIDGKGTLDVPTHEEVLLDGVKVHYFPITFRGWQYSYALHQNLKKHIREFDLVHLTSVFLSVSTLGAYYAKKNKRPYIISPRGSLMKEPLGKKSLKKQIYLSLIEKRNLQGASAIHFTTELEREEYVRGRLPLGSSVIVPNGLDFEELETQSTQDYFKTVLNIPDEKKKILFLSRLSWKKGLDDLIPAFSDLLREEPNAVLILAGGDDEGYKKEILKKMKECDLHEKQEVFLPGMLKGEEKISALQSNNLFVLPSYAENFGMAVAEAMVASGPNTTLVISESVGIAPLVEKTHSGIVIPKSKERLKEAMLNGLRNIDSAREMSKKAKQVAHEYFSWDGIAKNFIAEYDRLIKNNG